MQLSSLFRYLVASHLLSVLFGLNIEPNISRRNAVARTISSSIPFLISLPQSTNAATPLTAEEADNPRYKIERKLRKPPPRILRQSLNLDFAVLLMRSSYNAVDELDFVAMDQFQKDFFLIRQAEYLPYVTELGPGLVKQGDLTDPYYFDFISFAQYATIYRESSLDPAVVFEEQVPILVGEGTDDEKQVFVKKIIKRDPSIGNAMLAKKHDEIVGNTILDKLEEQFGNTASAIPNVEIGGGHSNAASMQRAIQQMVNLFVISGFSYDGKVVIKKEPKDSSSTASGAEFEIILTAPATLWSGQALALRRANTANDFVLKTAAALVTRAGYKVSSTSLTYSNSQEISTLSIV